MQRWPHRSIWVRPRGVALAVAAALLAAAIVAGASGVATEIGRAHV